MFNILNCTKKGKTITIRIENNDNLEIRLTDGKLYFQEGKITSISFSFYHLFQNTVSKDISILNYDKNESYYKLSFILNDLTNKTWYFVEVYLLEQKVTIKKQNYEK